MDSSNVAVNNCNRLPNSVVNVKSIMKFKRKLNKVWIDEKQRLDYTPTIESLYLRFDCTTTRSRVTGLISLLQESSVSVSGRRTSAVKHL